MRPIRFALLFLAAAVLAAPATANDARKGHAIAMHGEPKYPADFKHFDYVNPLAPKGGDVKLAATGTFDSFNPFIIKGNPAAGLGFIYDTLLTSSADEAFTEYGLLAETVETDAERTYVTFTLRKDAYWHDGKPISADDVIWTFNTLYEKGAPFYRYYYGSVAETEKLDERTVKFTFKSGENRELPLILGQLTVLPKHYWEGRDFESTTQEPPLGSGPYKIDGFEPGRYIVYRRNLEYWGAKHPVNVGLYNFDTIRYDYYRDATVQIEAFKGGEFDYRAENSSKAWATSYNIPEVEAGVIVKEELKHERAAGMQGFVFNTRRDKFQDRRVRQALAYVFDFEWSNTNLFYGQYSRTRSYFDNSELAARGLPEGEELEILERFRGRIPDEVFTTEYNPPATDGSGRNRANLKAAVNLLKEAGWEIRDKKLTNVKTGEVMTFEILLVSPLFERIVNPMAQSLRRIGIDASVRTVDSAQYRRRLDTFDFDVVTTVWGQSLSPGNEQRDYWSSDSADRDGSRNLAGIKDPAIDELIELVIAAPDRESLIQRVRALDRVLQWGFWVIPQFHSKVDRVVYWDKFGHPEETPTTGSNLLRWWIDEGRESTLAERRRSMGKG